MTELERIRHAKYCMDNLAEGIDPTTGELLPEDTLLNNIQLSRCFFLASDILRQVYENGGAVGQRRKIVLPPFSLPDEIRDQIEITTEPAMIRRFTDRINELVDVGAMQKLKVTAMTSWLVTNGYLCEETVNDKKRKPRHNRGKSWALPLNIAKANMGATWLSCMMKTPNVIWSAISMK